MTRKHSEESPGSLHVAFQFSLTPPTQRYGSTSTIVTETSTFVFTRREAGPTQLDSMKAAGTVPTPVSEAQSPAPFSQKSFLEDLRNLIIVNDLVSTLRCLPLPY
jgi:hypothetical protein